jgi:hypothetical protein
VGRILELCGEVAAEAEEGGDGIVLPADAWERFKEDWTEEEIEDALQLVRESLYQSELVEAADSLSTRLLDLLGAYGDAEPFASLVAGRASLGVEAVGQLARRVDRLEEILDLFRSDPPPDRRGFDALRQRLADQGIEAEMEQGRREEAAAAARDDEDDEDD